MHLLRLRSRLVLISLVIVLIVSLTGICSAQYGYAPWIPVTPYAFYTGTTFYSPYTPWFTPLPSYMPNFSLPTPIAPFPSLALPRTANAVTVITLPTATNTVTASAPLGTLNLTPSTLVFLLLYFTLH
jgi:hypothetical protein